MFGDRGSGSCGDERRGRGDIEGATGVSTGTASVHQKGLLVRIERNARYCRAHDVDKSREFFRGLSAGSKRADHGGDLNIGKGAGENLLHQFTGLFTRQRGTAFDQVPEMRLEGHQN